MKSFIRLLPLFVVLSAAVGNAQSYPVREIAFTGDPSRSQAELLAATGLKTGGVLGQADMQEAAKRLDATGMFSQVRFSFNGKTLTYALTPAAELLPARYDNLVWLDEKSLPEQLAAAVPLFHGRLALDSGTQDKVIETLKALLAQKGVEAKVSAEANSDLKTGKTDAIVFKVTSPEVRVGLVTFSGNSSGMSAPLAEVGTAALEVEYSATGTPRALSAAVENVYKDRGFLEVRVTEVTHGAPVLDEGKYRVPMTVAFEEGKQYRLGKFSLSGSVLTTEADFAKAAVLKPGDLVEQNKLKRTMQTLSGPYVTKGYIRAKITATPEFHREQQTVDYAVNVIPGDVYKMGKLDLQSIDEERKAMVLAKWRLKAGDPYDASYAPLFLKKDGKEIHALDGYSANYKQYEHEDTHVVDLVVTFQKGGLLN